MSDNSENVTYLADRRPPVTYTVTITHHWDGRIETFVSDVADDERSRASVGEALRLATELYLNERIAAAGDHLLENERLTAALKEIDRALAGYGFLGAEDTIKEAARIVREALETEE